MSYIEVYFTPSSASWRRQSYMRYVMNESIAIKEISKKSMSVIIGICNKPNEAKLKKYLKNMEYLCDDLMLAIWHC